MHAAEALGGHQRVLHAARLVLRHRLGSHKHDKEQHAHRVAVHLGGMVLPEDDLGRNKARRPHHASAMRLLAEIQDHAEVNEFHNLQRHADAGCGRARLRGMTLFDRRGGRGGHSGGVQPGAGDGECRAGARTW